MGEREGKFFREVLCCFFGSSEGVAVAAFDARFPSDCRVGVVSANGRLAHDPRYRRRRRNTSPKYHPPSTRPTAPGASPMPLRQRLHGNRRIHILAHLPPLDEACSRKQGSGVLVNAFTLREHISALSICLFAVADTHWERTYSSDTTFLAGAPGGHLVRHCCGSCGGWSLGVF